MVAMTDAAHRHTEQLPDCEFCQGTEAHDAGLPRSANPYPEPPAHLQSAHGRLVRDQLGAVGHGWIIAHLPDETESGS
jgi:hypothetical protein